MTEFLKISFEAEVIYWRGPSPFYFLKVPAKQAKEISQIAQQVTYGWGVIPANVTISKHDFYTALIPKDGTYLLPLKKSVRTALEIELGDLVRARAIF